jgi:hypothetical protein
MDMDMDSQMARGGPSQFPGVLVARWNPPRSQVTRQDFVAEAGASRKSVGSWELFVGT